MDAWGQYAGGVILALDTARHTGVCLGAPGQLPFLETLDFGKGGGDEFSVWMRARSWMAATLLHAEEEGNPVRLVALEGMVPQYDKTLQCGIYACMGAEARARQIPIMTAMPATWRAMVLGDGKLKRQPAKARALWLASQLGWRAETDDAAEAGCLWLYAIMQAAPGMMPKIPMFMREMSAGKARSAGRAA